MAHEVHQKWGFGMAPPKPATHAARAAAAERVVVLLDMDDHLSDDPGRRFMTEVKWGFIFNTVQNYMEHFAMHSRAVILPIRPMMRNSAIF